MNHPYVVIAPSYMVYSIDFNQFLHTHVESGADVTPVSYTHLDVYKRQI